MTFSEILGIVALALGLYTVIGMLPPIIKIIKHNKENKKK